MDLICAIPVVFSVFEDWGDYCVNINVLALGKLNDQMNLYGCRIISALEAMETQEAETEQRGQPNDD